MVTRAHGRMITDGSIGTADLADAAVTPPKLSAADTAASRSVIEAAGTEVSNTFNADQQIRSTDAGAGEGPALSLERLSASPAAADLIGLVQWRAHDAGGNQTLYGKISMRIEDPTDTTEDGAMLFGTRVAGALATRFILAAGWYAQGLTDPGAGLVNAQGYQRQNVALPLQLAFVSSEQTLTSAGQLTLAHSLGVMPTLVQARIKCLTAEFNYSIGDEVLIGVGHGDSANHGLSITPDATNLVIRFGSDATFLHILNKTTGGTEHVTLANWALIVRAWG